MTDLLALDAGGFRPWAAEAAAVYGEAMRRRPEVVVQRREIIGMHLAHAGFVATVAVEPGAGGERRLVGFGYGYLGAPGQWWYDAVARGLGPEAARAWLGHGFELAELHVLPSRQGRGLGRALLTDVLARAGAPTVLLSTPDTESPARQLYRDAGFVDVLCGFYFPGSAEAYAVMGHRDD